MKGKHEIFSAIAALSLSAALAIGTFAWTYPYNPVLNILASEGGTGLGSPGGTLHDDCLGGENKDIYVENWGGKPLVVRVKVKEYMEIGDGAGIKDDVSKNHAVSIHGNGTGEKIGDPSTWFTHDAGEGRIAGSDKFHDYWKWTMGGRKRYFPAPEGRRGAKAAGGNEYVDSSSPEGLAPGAVNADGIEAKETLNATVMTMAIWKASGQKIGPYWVVDRDGYSYWAEPLMPGDATGLLIDKVQLVDKLDEDYYYAIFTEAHMAAADGFLNNYESLIQDATPEAESLIRKVVAGIDADPAGHAGQ